MPPGLALYPGARLTSSTTIEGGGADKSGTILSFESPDSPGEITAFYKAAAQKAGYAIEGEVKMGEMEMLGGKSGDKGFNLTVNGTGDSNRLDCERGKKLLSLSESADPMRAVDQLAACAKQVGERADLRQYATWIAMRDLEAVRAVLGATASTSGAAPTAPAPRSSTCASIRSACAAWCWTAWHRPPWCCRPASGSIRTWRCSG